MERVHERGREPENELEFLKLCNESRNAMQSYNFMILILPTTEKIKNVPGTKFPMNKLRSNT